MKSQVLNNSQGPIYAQMQPSGTDQAGMIQHGEIIIFEKGLNLIDSKKLAALCENKTFEAFFKAKIQPSRAVEVDQRSVGKTILEIAGKDVEDDAPLAKLTEAACKAMISEMENTDILQNWLKGEGRAPVRRDIENRLTEIAGQFAGKPAQ